MSQPAVAHPSSLGTVLELTRAEMERVNERIRQRLSSDVLLIKQIAEHIIQGGGKRLRPVVHLLAARACGYEGRDHVDLAAIIEFIHTATLLHDDVVDQSEVRRGRAAAQTLWGNSASVLVGDFLYSRSFEMMVSLDRMPVMDVLARTTNTIAEGEVQQLLTMGDPSVDETRYMRVVKDKTARLFSAACELGAVLVDCESAWRQSLARFGTGLGSAFQIMDDVLDYSADGDTLGKQLGDDLAEGKPTLPLIYARERAGKPQREVLEQALRHPADHHLGAVMEILHDTRALERAREKSRQIAATALQELDSLPDTPHRHALATVGTYAVERDY